MSDEDSSPEPEANINIYLAQFRRHLAQVQAHLAGTESVSLLPSFLLPTGYWTAEEKDVFFHALSIHSRFRPDLIAACIKTKTTLDVCTYINALNNALSRNYNLPPIRSNLECAMEVSDSWVQWEEEKANDLVNMELEWEEESFKLRREEMTAGTALAETDVAPENGNLPCAESDMQRIWRQDNVLRRLDSHHLKVLDGMLRQTESGIADADTDAVQPEDQESQVAPVLVQPTARILPSVVSEDMIDPVLRLSESDSMGTGFFGATDRNLQQPEPSSLPVGDAALLQPPVVLPRPSPGPGDKDTGCTDAFNLTPTSRRRFQKRLYMRRKRAEQRGEDVISNIAKLRPGRKAKERKPPKQRPKFHKTKNKTPSPDENDDCDDPPMDIDISSQIIPVTLFPAENDPEDHPQTQEHDPEGSKEHEDTDNSEDDTHNNGHQTRHSKGGSTKPYRIKKDFTENGIDGNTLIEGNLGLFHLATLDRLMKLYKSGYDKTTTITATAISADTIRSLTAIIEEFTSEVVHRTIISREQDKKMKGDIKVYGRSHDEITPENVGYVLDMMGMRGLTGKKYFAQLLGEDTSATPKVESDAEEQKSSEDESTSQDEGSDGENHSSLYSHQSTATDFPALLPLHRELHPPFIHLPGSLSLPTDPAMLMDKDFFMPEHIDEEGFETELEEEHELDEVDSSLAQQYEADLWKLFGLEHQPKNVKKGTRTRTGRK